MVRKWMWMVAWLCMVNVTLAGQVLELHFDEGEGEEALDTSGMDNHGELMGAEWVDGRIGAGLHFDGTGSHVAVADAPSLQITDEMTVAAWVRFDMLGASGNHDAIVAKAGTWSFITFRRTDPPYQFAWWDNVVKNLMPGEPKWIASEWVPEIEQWYHLAVTMRAGETLQFYRDGEVIAESEYPLAIPAGAGQPIWIGKGNGTTENLAGTIDEVVIFDETLPSDQVQDLAGLTSPVTPAAKLGMTWATLKRMKE